MKDISKEELIKKRKNLLYDLVNKIQSTIINNDKVKEDSRKISIYSRLAEYTYYSEVSIRKFLSGALPKDISGFLSGIINYCNYLNIEKIYIDNFITEYSKACSKIILNEDIKQQKINNIINQDLSNIVRTKKVTEFFNEFLKEKTNIAYIYGYKLSGKTKSTMAYINDLIESGNINYNYIVWTEILNNDNIRIKLIDSVLNITETIKEYNEADETIKKEIFFELITNNKFLLILDINDEFLSDEDVEFIKQISVNTKIIIISSINFEKYSNILYENVKSLSINKNMTIEETQIMLNMYTNLSNIFNYNPDLIEKLFSITEGYPFPTLYIARLIVKWNKYGKSIGEILEEYDKPTEYNELNEKIIGSVWSRLSQNAKNILFICSMFSHTISLKLIAYVCNIKLGSNEWIEALNMCYEENLITHVFEVSPRCKMHGFIKLLIKERLKNEFNLEKKLLDKISNYYIKLTGMVSECYNNINRMSLLDEQDEYEITCEVLELLYNNSNYKEYILIDKNIKYYTYVRGYWLVGEKSERLKRAKAAKNIGDINAEIEGYCDYVKIMSKAKNNEESIKYIIKIDNVLKNNDMKNIEKRILPLINHVKAIYLFCCHEAYSNALALLRENVEDYGDLMSEYGKLVNTLWIDKCKYYIEKDMDRLYTRVMNNYKVALDKNFIRGVEDYILLLCNILFSKYNNINDNNILYNIRSWLNQTKELLEKTNNLDRRNLAEYYRLCVYYEHYNKNTEQMKIAYEKAVELYKKLGNKKDIKLLEEYLKNNK